MVALLVFLALVAAVGLVGGQFRPDAWFEALAKPVFNPPPWVFAPVWLALYVCIAIAGWMVWRGRTRRGLLLGLWGAQLVCNGLWSWLFFGLHRPELALVDIVALLATLLAFLVVAWPARRTAAWLFVPYAAWVGFATVLNAAIWRLNTVR